jgi:hypothetical protein
LRWFGGGFMEWMIDIIKEYIVKNRIRTTSERIEKLQAYFIHQQYNTVGLVCDALIADSAAVNILTVKR